MRIILLGPPGSGKGTQAKLLQDRFSLKLIGTGDLLRTAVRDGTPTGKQAHGYMAAGHLVPDDLVNQIVADFFHRADPPQRFLFDGYPRTVAQADFLTKTLTNCRLPIDRVLFFDVPEDELVRRMNTRRLAESRADDDEATIRKRLEIYRSQTAPLVEHYRNLGQLAIISATGDVEEIHRRVMAQLTPIG